MSGVVSRDITGQMIVLGTGTSVGVPMIGCGCDVCRSTNPKNSRTRCSVILGLPEGNLLIDTSPDMREQLLREKIGLVNAVLYTHEHADHLFGLDDLRLMQFYLGGPLPLYCEPLVEQRIRKSFDYAFASLPNLHAGAIPKIEFHPIGPVNDGHEPFSVLGATVTPVRQSHGPNFVTLGFRFGDVAYCTDVCEMPDESKDQLRGLEVLVLDALRTKPHPTHFSLDQAVALAQELGAKQTYFTHMSHDLEHEAVNASLPEGMQLAYDGLRIELC
ncbi:Phosphoribosyl 1,2-cyclic phosphodiesterase [Posidoniimonas polymericola]|uniref:Phosphoribosyl 1,2-cyclic phosphodiesterase n=1 Tax=Posidoniimonas polymericola TaxID=2528002 RepID=A0A5C5YAH0_9BACT|nr:MBL fold metallo-hydrolase [Posidoniimonas polymericola]TWT72696.1 Phosphoribosyl 1,2-cyclic phosphodiesterase [Posidoniimonas polymericola]